MSFLLEQSSRLDAEFAVWFFSRDYDDFWSRVRAMGMDELFMLWKDTGLFDEDGKERKSLEIWDHWLRLRKR
ncbi:MAG: hypothetical protein JSV25_04265 [Spirochaetota bacterium]|nr:MAG: hypothetical protein JSV25_04265 [Spirochaetota bacterium]